MTGPEINTVRKRSCKYCGAVIPRIFSSGKLKTDADYKRQSFCSPRCGSLHAGKVRSEIHKESMRTCERCGGKFARRRYGHGLEAVGAFEKRKYCSHECRLGKDRNYKPRKCKTCGEPMARKRRTYCSNYCRPVANAQKRQVGRTQHDVDRTYLPIHVALEKVKRQKEFAVAHIAELAKLPLPTSTVMVENLIASAINQEKRLRPVLWGTVRQLTEELNRGQYAYEFHRRDQPAGGQGNGVPEERRERVCARAGRGHSDVPQGDGDAAGASP